MVAYSTMVHVSLMVVGLACAAGLGVSVGAASTCASATSFVPSIGLAHLLSHSFAKAALFCCVGVLLHGALSQDMREFGAWAASAWLGGARIGADLGYRAWTW